MNLRLTDQSKRELDTWTKTHQFDALQLLTVEDGLWTLPASLSFEFVADRTGVIADDELRAATIQAIQTEVKAELWRLSRRR